MVRFIAIGLWVCLVALGALVLGVQMKSFESTKSEDKTAMPGNIRQEHSELISVPVMAGGKVSGYVVAKLICLVDSNIKNRLSVPLGFFVNDEIFRMFFTSYSDTHEIEKVKFDDVRQKIIDGVNQRFSEPVIKDLLVEQFNFISADQARDMSR